MNDGDTKVGPAAGYHVGEGHQGKIIIPLLQYPNYRLNGIVYIRRQDQQRLDRKAAHVPRPRKPQPKKTAGLREKKRQQWLKQWQNP